MPVNNALTSKAAFKRQVQLILFQMLRNTMHEGNKLTSTSLSLHSICINPKNPAKMSKLPSDLLMDTTDKSALLTAV